MPRKTRFFRVDGQLQSSFNEAAAEMPRKTPHNADSN